MEIKQKYNPDDECYEIKVKLDEFDDLNKLKPLIRLYVHDVGAVDDCYSSIEIETKNGFRLRTEGSSSKEDEKLNISFTINTYFHDIHHLEFQVDVRTINCDGICELIFDQFMLTINHYKIKKLEKVGNEML